MSSPNKSKTREQALFKKLQPITSASQLKSILKASTQQNKKLIEQVRQLRNRVEAIISSHRSSIDQRIEISPKNEKESAYAKKEMIEIRKQLKNKYSKMKQLKDQIQENKVNRVQQAELTKAKNANLTKQIEKQVKNLTKQQLDLLKMHKKLLSTLQNNNKNDLLNQPRIEELEQQNKGLRLKIVENRKNDYYSEKESIQVQTTMIGSKIKIKQMDARKSMLDLKKQTLFDKSELVSPSGLQNLKKQVNQLKKQATLVEETKKQQEAEKRTQRNSLYISNKQLLKQYKGLQSQKHKLEQQNNYEKKKWLDICKAIELHNKKIKKIAVSVQAEEYTETKALRRDYAGILNKHRYQDRIILKQNQTAKIVGMMIYEIQRGIVAMQAFYNTGDKSYLPMPNHFIERCRVTKIECSQNDFFKLFKIKYNTIDNKITKVEIRSNKNIKFQYGEKKQWTDLVQGDTIYGFDIGIREYPVCAFGSYYYQKGNWLLEGFGVEINQLIQ